MVELRLLTVEFSARTTTDQARTILALLDELHISQVTAVGCSYGAMVCLALAALAALAPERVERVVAIGASHRTHALASAWRRIQWSLLDWGERAGEPATGIALARQLAMTTYRDARALDARFLDESLERWLAHHGERYADTVSAGRYRALSQAVDAHRVDPAHLTMPVDLVGFTTDQLVPPWLLEELHAALPVPGALHLLDSPHGHDAFLLEQQALAPLLLAALGVTA